jgi:hypothetical protein
MTEQWTTRLDPEVTRLYGLGEAHSLWFVPQNCPAPPRNVIAFLIPECEMQFVVPARPTVFINRPRANRNVKCWLRYACEEATYQNAVLIVTCDTAEQAERAAKLAIKLLPDHERAAIERIYEEAARARTVLS